MNEQLRSFLGWGVKYLQDAPFADAQVELALGRPTTNQAAHLTIENDRVIGRVTVWERGSAHAEVLNASTGEATDVWHWERVQPTDFNITFEPFTKRFSPGSSK